MRIWLDISNSPHINFFKALICDLQNEGHDVVITSRPLANTVALLQLHGFDFDVVGVHYGKQFVRKLLGYPIRVTQLFSHLRSDVPDVSISHSSFHSPITSRLLGCRSIYMNDNEHALGNIPSFIFANKIMIPEYLSIEKVRRFGGARRKIIQYPGVKEGVYLWNLAMIPQDTDDIRGAVNRIPTIYVRPEPWTAQYYRGGHNFMDETILELSNHANVKLLPRGAAQAEHYLTEKFSGVEVQADVADLPQIVADCDLFIGAGGTMTREMAVVGTPTISVYQDALLDVDRYLISIDQMLHKPDLDAVFALHYLESCTGRTANRELLAKGQEAYQLIKSVLLGQTN